VLAARARELGLDCFSSPFDDAAVTFLEELDVPAYKIASFELVDIPLIERVARTGKPVILSAGMADRSEIEAALAAVRRAGGEQVVVLKCTSSYPAPPESMNLRSIPAWTDAFGVPVGLSDHSLDIAVPVAAVALGACVVEKHLTLRRSDGGPDASFSLEPHELADTVAAVRITERALGRVVWEADEADRAMRRYRRSLFAVADVAEGELLTVENVRSIRPADGLAPARLADLLGRRARRAIARGTPMRDDLVD
jgi:pseudaminic acid synthase